MQRFYQSTPRCRATLRRGDTQPCHRPVKCWMYRRADSGRTEPPAITRRRVTFVAAGAEKAALPERVSRRRRRCLSADRRPEPRPTHDMSRNRKVLGHVWGVGGGWLVWSRVVGLFGVGMGFVGSGLGGGVRLGLAAGCGSAEGCGVSRIFLSHSSRANRAAVALKQWLAEQDPPLANEIFLDTDPDNG